MFHISYISIESIYENLSKYPILFEQSLSINIVYLINSKHLEDTIHFLIRYVFFMRYLRHKFYKGDGIIGP